MRLLYIRAPKTGSSTTVNWCKNSVARTDILNFLDEEENLQKINRAIKNNYLIFTTVRNPFTRAVSQWKHMIEYGCIKETFTFEEFMTFDFKESDKFCRIHSSSLNEYLSPFLCKITKIIKMESLENELKKLETDHNLSVRKVGFYNKGQYLNSFDYKDFYTQDRINLVLNKYEDDFDAFNYSKSIDF